MYLKDAAEGCTGHTLYGTCVTWEVKRYRPESATVSEVTNHEQLPSDSVSELDAKMWNSDDATESPLKL